MCKCHGSDEQEMMHHYIIEKLECLHKEVIELKEKMGFIGLKLKYSGERSCHSFKQIEGKIDCLKGMVHHEMNELEDELEDLYVCSEGVTHEECECPECREHEESSVKK